MDMRQETVNTYNNSAAGLSKYFQGIGSRVEDIESAIKLAAGPSKPKFLEIGCGDGRDALEILKHTDNYLGFDISEELIKLARSNVPTANFEVADAISFDYPQDVDIVFAFASLLHLDCDEVRSVCRKVYDSLRPGGVFYISLKYKPEYESSIKEDEFGKRLFYFYTPKLIEDLAGDGFVTKKVYQHSIGQTDWFEIAFTKLSNNT